jgi:Spy/CpxP family protein refolding chaperone
MPRLVQVLLALSLLLNAFFLAGFIFRSTIAPLPFEAPVASSPPPPRPSVLEVVANDVSLDPGQRQALRGVFEQYSALRRDRGREIQKLREQIVAEYKRSPIDQPRAGALLEQLARLRVEQQKDTLRSLAQIEAELKPEQRERMHQVLAERLTWPPRQPGAPGAPGPGGPPRPTQ